ncbi:MAG: hypothetical protein QOH35_4425 [Acidobacteriaceae bacterium]|nr:hypothetical protein [Acidobacteriaceae bacterium]
MSISRWGMSKCMCCSAIRPNSRVVANPDMHPFWGDFRVGGYPPATREDVRNDLRKGLDEWVGEDNRPMRFDLWNRGIARCSAAQRRSLLFFSWIFLPSSPRGRACSNSARLIGAGAGLVRLRGKRVQNFGPHEHTPRMGSDWPVMAELLLIEKTSIKLALNYPDLVAHTKPRCTQESFLGAPGFWCYARIA